ncbi:MAG: type IV secretion system DotC family protein [Gammaproteobacteria bacterium]
MQIYTRKLVWLLPLFLFGCSASQQPGTDTLPALQALKAKAANSGKKSKGTSKIREMALKETALSVGAQSGLAFRAKVIDDQLVKQTKYLDAIYDFNSLLLENNVLPPVLLEGRNTLNLADTQTIRISDRVYKVSKQAHFVTTPPNWRQYLWMDYRKPEAPHLSLLPKTKDEREIWVHYVTKGWQNGIEQANNILEENIARIKEDFTGMILYRKLLAMNMVTPPYVSHTDLGITGDEQEIHIDDKVLRITALPALNMNSNEWRAAIAKDEKALEQLNNLEKKVENAKVKIPGQSWRPIIGS